MKLKAYKSNGTLLVSKPLTSQAMLEDALCDLLKVHNDIRCVYISTKDGSKQIINGPAVPARPIYYTRSNGERVYTLPLLTVAYPITAHYADGRTVLIGLS